MKKSLLTIALLCALLSLCPALIHAAGDVDVAVPSEEPANLGIAELPEIGDAEAVKPEGDQINASYIISDVSATITAPVAGAKPSYIASVPSYANYSVPSLYSTEYSPDKEYHRNGIAWMDLTDNCSLNPSDAVFVAGHKYRVIICLKANDGYEFSDEPDGEVNDARAGVTLRGSYCDLYYDFPAAPVEVTSVSLTISAPTVGKTPDASPKLVVGAAAVSNTTVYWNDATANQYLSSDSYTFVLGHVYEVTIYLRPKAEYKFSDTTSCTFNGKNVETSVDYYGNLVVYYKFLAAGYENITSVSATITAPKNGAKPDYSPKLTAGADHISGITAYWYDATDEKFIPSGSGTFAAGHIYEVYLYLSAKSGYQFGDTVSCTLNGNKAGSSVDSFGDLVMTYEFPAVALEKITSVTVTITEPKVGAKPDYSPRLSAGANCVLRDYTQDEFKNGVAWYDKKDKKWMTATDKFVSGHEYSVTVYLTPKKGYEFTSGSSVSINGEGGGSVRLYPDYFEIDYTFTTAGFKEISSVSVTLTAPKIGAKPSYDAVIPAGANYSTQQGVLPFGGIKNGIYWYDDTKKSILNPDSSDVFIEGHVYTVNITVTAKDGYKFSYTTPATVNGKTAETTTNVGGTGFTSLKLEYTFPALSYKPVKGDVNDDGDVTALDRLLLTRYLAGWKSYKIKVNLTNADINNDGKVTAIDRVILSRYLAGWSGYKSYCGN